ncbi:MAG: GNAT family N-acetyltransferase [Candidatus Dormibacteria bacterium]
MTMDDQERPRRSHPDHDVLRAEVRSWYHRPALDMGYAVWNGPLGTYSRHGPTGSIRVIMDSEWTGSVDTLRAELRSIADAAWVEVWVEELAADRRLAPLLQGAGCSSARAMTYLAHVGPVPQSRPHLDVVITEVTEDNLHEFAVTKLQGFADSEVAPSTTDLAIEATRRQSEMSGKGRFLIAHWGQEPVTVLGFYEGSDILVFLLATRVPYRYKGVARHLLQMLLQDTTRRQRRSVILNADPSDSPILFYRRLGFTDEVYWHSSYRWEWPPPAGW